jgi:class 3 adenylate cyclase
MYHTPILNKINNQDFEKKSRSIPDYSVVLSSSNENYCIGMVDMVDSTNISANLGNRKASRYYEIFLNYMAKIIGRFSGFVIKNIGDCLLYYFPESIKPHKKFRLTNCLESSLAMIEHHDVICDILKKENLPSVNYRVSMDYGTVVLMKSNMSFSIDMIGSPINICSKINRYAQPNGVVVGGDLYEQVKHLDNYCFKETSEFSLGFKASYPIYSIKRK